MDLLTTAEAADYLRLGERKLYELVAENRIPCSKVTGKWLFPRHELDRWILSGLARPAGMIPPEPPPIIGGSQDDLLEWSLRQAGSGLASLAEGTKGGVARLLRGEVAAAAIHFHGEAADANVAAVHTMPQLHDAVLIGFARREQGLLLPPGNPGSLHSLTDVLEKRARMAVRQPGAGAHMLLDLLLAGAGANQKDLHRLEPPCLTGPDLATAIRTGRADCGIATRAAARAAGLEFVPLAWENFDLLMRQRTYFQPPLQALITFLAEENFTARAAELTGYFSAYGTVAGTPDADFLARFSVGGGASWRAYAPTGSWGPLVLTLDGRHDVFDDTSVTTLSPAAQYFFFDEKLALQVRWIHSVNDEGTSANGYAVRADLAATDRLRLIAGYSDAPEISEGTLIDTKTVFTGISFDLSAALTLQANYAYEHRETFDRNSFGLGLAVRF